MYTYEVDVELTWNVPFNGASENKRSFSNAEFSLFQSSPGVFTFSAWYIYAGESTAVSLRCRKERVTEVVSVCFQFYCGFLAVRKQFDSTDPTPGSEADMPYYVFFFYMLLPEIRLPVYIVIFLSWILF